MNETLLTRRTEMLDLISKGTPLQDTIAELASKYQVPAKGLYNDWGRRGKWLKQIVRLQDPTLIEQLLRGLQQVIPSAWIQYATGDNSNAKIGALRLIKETYLDLIQTLQSLGIAVKMPEKVNLDVDLTDTLKLYETAISNAVDQDIHAHSAPQPLDTGIPPASTTQRQRPPSEASAVSSADV